MKIKPTVLAVIGICVLMILSACGSNNSKSTAASGDDGEVKEIVVYQMMREYCGLAENTIDKVMLEEHNTRVICQDLASAETFTKVQSERNDPVASVIVGDVNGIAAGIGEGYYEKLDPEIVTNLDEIDSNAKEVLGEEMVAMSYAAVGLTYRKDLFEEAGIAEPKGWEDLFNPDLQGQVGMFASGISAPYELVVSLAQTEGGDQFDVDPGFDKVEKLVDTGQISSFYESGSMMYQGLLNGEIYIGPGYSEGSLELANDDERIEFIYPEDGYARSVRGTALVKDSPNQKEAQEYINLLLSKEYQEVLANERWHAPVRTDLDLSEELTEKLKAYPGAWDDAYDMDWVELSKVQGERYDRWARDVEQK